MIVAPNFDARQYLGIHPNLDVALNHITPEFLSSLGNDRVDLIPGEVWCTRFTYETISDEESFFEAHERFLDIHLMLEGCERVEIAPPRMLEFWYSQPENDFYAYRGQGQQKLLLTPGQFLVAFPEDAHKIKMLVDTPKTVTKAVFKVKLC